MNWVLKQNHEEYCSWIAYLLFAHTNFPLTLEDHSHCE